MPTDGGDAEQVIAEFRRAGVDDAALATAFSARMACNAEAPAMVDDARSR